MRISIALLFPLLLLSACSTTPPRHPYWEWSADLPKRAYTKEAPDHRTAEAMDAFFYEAKKDMPLKDVLKYFGRPDGFSPQYINSMVRSSATTTETGGTLRFLLDGEGEFHVWTPNFATAGVAVAFVKQPLSFRGYHTYLLYNSAAIPSVEKVYGTSVYLNKKDKEQPAQEKYR